MADYGVTSTGFAKKRLDDVRTEIEGSTDDGYLGLTHGWLMRGFSIPRMGVSRLIFGTGFVRKFSVCQEAVQGAIPGAAQAGFVPREKV